MIAGNGRECPEQVLGFDDGVDSGQGTLDINLFKTQ